MPVKPGKLFAQALMPTLPSVELIELALLSKADLAQHLLNEYHSTDSGAGRCDSRKAVIVKVALCSHSCREQVVTVRYGADWMSTLRP